jgi:uncharacterized protein YlxW (UPF0749 family)
VLVGIKKSTVFITFMCVLLGFFTAKSFNNRQPGTVIGEVASITRIEKLLKEKGELEAIRNDMNTRLKELESAIEARENEFAQVNKSTADIQQELKNARSFAGLLPLEGPGIEIVLNDRQKDNILLSNPGMLRFYIVHDSDMLNIINELRAAGAEAISINDTRIMANSRISCGGPIINVGKYQRFAPPFVIRAIGDPDKLAGAFESPDSIYHMLKAWGLRFEFTKQDKIMVPRSLGDGDYQYAKPLEESE